MEYLLKVVSQINACLSDYVLVFLLVGAGIFFTIRTRFVQVRCFVEGWQRAFGKIRSKAQSSGNAFSPFQALATAVTRGQHPETGRYYTYWENNWRSFDDEGWINCAVFDATMMLQFADYIEKLKR